MFIYGYPSKLQNSGSHIRLPDYTKNFLEDLRRLSNRDGHKVHALYSLKVALLETQLTISDQKRPIILVGHSMGGLIIKQVCNRSLRVSRLKDPDFGEAIIEADGNINDYGKLFDLLHSLVFFGVPHRGMNTAALEEMVAREPTRGLVEELKENSPEIGQMSSKFAGAASSMHIVTCRETVETETMQKNEFGVWKRTGRPEMMVSEHSACLYTQNEKIVIIQANHSMIAKLSDDEGSQYPNVRELIAEHVSLAYDSLERRWAKRESRAALQEVSMVAEFVLKIISVLQSRRADASNVQGPLGQEVRFLQVFRSGLDEGELGAILSDRRLSVRYPQGIAAILRKLKATFASFTALAIKYHEPYRNSLQCEDFTTSSNTRSQPSVTSQELESPLLEDTDVTGVLFSNQTLEATLRSCRESTEDLKRMLAQATLCSFDGDPTGAIGTFLNNPALGLAPIVHRQNLVKANSFPVPKALLGHLEEVPKGKTLSEVQLAHYRDKEQANSEPVIVEYRSHRAEVPEKNLGQGEVKYNAEIARMKGKMRQLAGLLQAVSVTGNGRTSYAAGEASSYSSYLECLGLIEQTDRYRFAFIFRLPPQLSLESATGLRSLWSHIEGYRSQDRLTSAPPLEHRFFLAYHICQALLDIHANGWVHKNIRSENIMLVPGNPPKIPTPLSEDQGSYVPILKGFEFARSEQASSSNEYQADLESNLYRHHTRQGLPTEYFRKDHDIYAIGVVLLEIGCWKTMHSSFDSMIKKAKNGEGIPKADERTKMLLDKAQRKLPFFMGTKYALAVESCLKGLNVELDDKHQTLLSLAFKQNVRDFIKAGMGF